MSTVSRSASPTSAMPRRHRLHGIGASRGAYLLLGAALALSLWAADALANSHTGRGDFDFYLDSAAVRDKGGNVLTEISVRIPSRGLKFVPGKGGFKATVNMQLLIVDDAGKDVPVSYTHLRAHATPEHLV